MLVLLAGTTVQAQKERVIGTISSSVHPASPAVDDIIVVPRNYLFTWGSSGQNIAQNNTVYCSSNPDFTRVLYWRTSDTDPNAGVNDWNPNVLVAGNYDIYAYIPDYTHAASITTQAKYYFNGSLLAQIDQNQNKCQWVLLGRRWLTAGSEDTITLPAQTSDNPYRLIAGDGMKLVYVSPATYSISGRIADSGGSAISGVLVTASGGQNVATDANGNYTLSGLLAGSYTLTPSWTGITFSPVSRQVTVGPNAAGQNFTATNRYALSGRVTDAAMTPIANVSISCVDQHGFVKTVNTDNNGNYVCSNLPGSLYLIRGAAGSPYTLSPRVRGWLFVPPNRTGQDFTTTSIYGAIGGRVTKQGTATPIVSARVSVAGKVIQTDANGNYNITGMLPGNHTLYASASGYQDYQDTVTIQANFQTLKDVALIPIPIDGYRLPYPGGNTYKLENTAHPSGYAQDWGIPTGRNVVAARAGKVIQVQESSNAGGCNNAYLGKENFVTLLHSDGKLTLYVHLVQNSVPVKVRDDVRSGQVIGKSDSTGKACGPHLHFAQMYNKKRIVPYFLDVPGGVPQVGSSYTSGNYLTMLTGSILEVAAPLTDTVAPEGSVQFQLTGQPTYTIQIETFDYDSDYVLMRLAATATELQSTAWLTAANSVKWTAPIVYGQFKDATGNVSFVYSDTLEAIDYQPIQAAFAISPTVCAGTEPQIQNMTTPLCEQCGWNWDFGDGNFSSSIDAELPYTYLTPIYTDTGRYTVTLTAANINSFSSVAHAVEVISAPSGVFSMTQLGTLVTVEAESSAGTTWKWDFGDGSTATGRTAAHIYPDTDHDYVIQLTAENAGGCSTVAFQHILAWQKVYLPTIRK
jgi:hypothetical protein